MICVCRVGSAFDTIDHQILLQRLEHLIGIRGTARGRFKSYYLRNLNFFMLTSWPPNLVMVSFKVLWLDQSMTSCLLDSLMIFIVLFVTIFTKKYALFWSHLRFKHNSCCGRRAEDLSLVEVPLWVTLFSNTSKISSRETQNISKLRQVTYTVQFWFSYIWHGPWDTAVNAIKIDSNKVFSVSFLQQPDLWFHRLVVRVQSVYWHASSCGSDMPQCQEQFWGNDYESLSHTVKLGTMLWNPLSVVKRTCRYLFEMARESIDSDFWLLRARIFLD